MTAIDKGVYLVHREEEKISTINHRNTSPVVSLDKLSKEDTVKKSWFTNTAPTIIHYVTLTILGGLTWGYFWFAWGENWSWNGQWFRLVLVGIIAWVSGEILQELTTLPPLLAALLTGILARNLGFINMRDYTEIDGLLRKIYPVIILGKGSLTWDVAFMRRNWKQVLALGALPWITEVATVAICTHFLLSFPWIWGFLLGSFYASVSCPVIMPSVIKHAKTLNGNVNWIQLVCTAGGLDTTLSVGTFGVIFSFIFYDFDDSYHYIKAFLALPLGVVLGVAWGSLAKYIPNSEDVFATEFRVLFVLFGGLFVNICTSSIGWGGTGGVAVLACNATAATHWAKKGWKLNQNPAATVYRVLWSTCEPILFAYTGTFFVVHDLISQTMLIGLGILALCLSVRLVVAALVCWKFTMREKLFICCTWIPKSIVEAVLCPMAISAIIMSNGKHSEEREIAEQLLRLIVQAILITTPVGFLLTSQFGGKLLNNNVQSDEITSRFAQRKCSVL